MQPESKPGKETNPQRQTDPQTFRPQTLEPDPREHPQIPIEDKRDRDRNRNPDRKPETQTQTVTARVDARQRNQSTQTDRPSDFQASDLRTRYSCTPKLKHRTTSTSAVFVWNAISCCLTPAATFRPSESRALRLQTLRPSDSQTHRPSDPQTVKSVRYCPECPKCDECGIVKPRKENFADDGNENGKNYSKRCLTCEYPQCTHCPSCRHPRKSKAVHMRHKVCGEWFCKRTTACKKAHAAALKAANNKL